MDSHPGKDSSHHSDKVAKRYAPIDRLPAELLHKILHDSSLTDRIVTDRPAETARNLSILARVSGRFREALGPGTPLGEYRGRLRKLGLMAEAIKSMAFPRRGPSAPFFGDPRSAKIRLKAGRHVIGFVPDAEQKELVEGVVAIPDRGCRLNALLEMTQSNELHQLAGGVVKTMTPAIFHEAGKTDLDGALFQYYSQGIAGQLQDDDISVFSKIYGKSEECVREMRQGDQEWAAQSEVRAPGGTLNLDARIDALGDRIVAICNNDITDRAIAYDTAVLAKSVRDLNRDSRRSCRDRGQLREQAGR